MKIEIESGQTRSIGKNMLDDANKFKSYIKQINYIVDNINNIWTGADSLVYINAMREKCIPELEKLGDCLTNYGTYLQNVGTSYEILDETFNSKTIDV